MIGMFALQAKPFSWPRFLAYMAGLALLAWVQWRSHLPSPESPAGAGPAERVEVLRFGRPADELLPKLRSAGLPWFLRRAGATAVASVDNGRLTLDIALDDKPFGRYVESLTAIDIDRSKLIVQFEAADPARLSALVKPIGSPLDPMDLMRVVMAEHLRSSVAKEGFDLAVLETGLNPLAVLAGKVLRHQGACPPPRSDNFELCGPDAAAAAYRRAEREEKANPRPVVAPAPRPRHVVKLESLRERERALRQAAPPPGAEYSRITQH